MAYTQAQKVKVLSHLLATLATEQNPAPPAYTIANQINPILSTGPDSFTNYEMQANFSDDDDEDQAPVTLSISTPLHITGDDNLVAVDTSLAAAKIATAILSAMKQMSMGGAGIPMFDDDGKSRAIKVVVDATTKIDGHSNVVGEGGVLMASLKIKMGRDGAGAAVATVEEGSGSGGKEKREKRGGEPAAGMGSKRQRVA